MAKLTLGIGLFLIAVTLLFIALAGFQIASPTALIPAGFGVVFLVCGLLGLKPALRKHAMHVAVAFALLAGLASVMRLPTVAAQASEDAGKLRAAVLMAITFLACLTELVMGVRSFIVARRSRDAGTPAIT